MWPCNKDRESRQPCFNKKAGGEALKSCCCTVCGNGVSFVSWERAESCSCGIHRAHTAVNEAVSASTGTQQ